MKKRLFKTIAVVLASTFTVQSYAGLPMDDAFIVVDGLNRTTVWVDKIPKTKVNRKGGVIKRTAKDSIGWIDESAPRLSGSRQLELLKLLKLRSAQYDFDDALLLQLVRQESGFNPNAVSNKGAIGLMQVMPATGARFGAKNLSNADENIQAGLRYLKYLDQLFAGDIVLILAAYNAGEGAVIKYGYKIPPYLETQTYVLRIMERYLAERARREQAELVDD